MPYELTPHSNIRDILTEVGNKIQKPVQKKGMKEIVIENCEIKDVKIMFS